MLRDWLGQLADRVRPERRLRRWTLSLLYLAPTDQVLEIRDCAAMPDVPDGGFDKAYTVHGLQLDMAALAEVHRVLRVGGLLAVTLQPRWDADLNALQAELETRLVAAGFGQLRALRLAGGPTSALCVLGVRQAETA